MGFAKSSTHPASGNDWHFGNRVLESLTMAPSTGPRGTMNLGAFFHPTGNHVASWLHPGAQIDAGTNIDHYVEITRTAERGKFDMIFLADAVATGDGDLSALKRWPQYMAYFEPTTL